MISIQILQKLKLNPAEIRDVVRLAKEVQKLENRWNRKFEIAIDSLIDSIVFQLKVKGELQIPKEVFEDLVFRHSFQSMLEGFKSTRTKGDKLAAIPKGRVPRSLKDLMKMWDDFRKKRVIPPRQKKIAENLRKAYIEKCKSVWEKQSSDFVKGVDFDQKAAKDAIKKAAKTTSSRASTIVNTETTRYYNEIRRKVYDESDDITHYLFVAVRDAATTKWCRSRQGLVYAKGSPYLDKETPPIHWNCRSEMLPLSPLNPNHLAIIKNSGRMRINNRCEPLPKDWNK